MEIFGRPGRTTREVTLGRVIRESLSAEGLFQQKGERALRWERPGIWGRAKPCGGMVLNVFLDPRQREGTWGRVVQGRREKRSNGDLEISS